MNYEDQCKELRVLTERLRSQAGVLTERLRSQADPELAKQLELMFNSAYQLGRTDVLAELQEHLEYEPSLYAFRAWADVRNGKV